MRRIGRSILTSSWVAACPSLACRGAQPGSLGGWLWVGGGVREWEEGSRAPCGAQSVWAGGGWGPWGGGGVIRRMGRTTMTRPPTDRSRSYHVCHSPPPYPATDSCR